MKFEMHAGNCWEKE